MKIEREGIQYVLSPQELYEAYEEQEHLYDEQDIRNELNERLLSAIDDEDERQADPLRELIDDEEAISEMAHEKRRNINKYGMHWETAVFDAIRDFIKSNYPEEDEND